MHIFPRKKVGNAVPRRAAALYQCRLTVCRVVAVGKGKGKRGFV